MSQAQLSNSLNSIHHKPTRQQLEQDFSISARTAITRRAVSAPLKMLIDDNRFYGLCFHFGKGVAQLDSDALNSCPDVYNLLEYDYTYCIADVLDSDVDTLYCGYVLNTLPLSSRSFVWQQIAHLVRGGGKAYIAVRSDKDRGIKGEPHLDGVRTSRGTFQIGFTKDYLEAEALNHFSTVNFLRSKSGFYIIECSNE